MIPHDSRARGVRRFLSLITFLAATAAFSACTGNTNLPSEAGNWSGTLNDQASGNGTISMTLSQSEGTLSGTYTIANLPLATDDETGAVSGTLSSDTSGSLTLTPTDANRCVVSGLLTLTGNQMTVSYVNKQ